MNCPVCNVELKMTDRQGVEIDYCPKCRGVWLDRGELDKIIERSETTGFEASERDRYDEHNRRHDEQYRRNDEHNRQSDQPYKKHKKKESFLSNLFDFD
jgi:Zn-finger nucleic acid-binding protein